MMRDIGEIATHAGDSATYTHVVATGGRVKTTIHHESPRGLSGDSFEITAEQASMLARLYNVAAFAAEMDERQLNLFGAP